MCTYRLTLPKILVIDECDSIDPKRDSQLIFNILEWAHKHRSRLMVIVIGINAQWQTELPGNVRSRMGTAHLVFAPYSKEQ